MHTLTYRLAELLGIPAITVSVLLVPLTVSPGQDVTPLKAIYGVSRFEGKSHEETAVVLRDLGVNAVFIQPDSAFIEVLHKKGIQVFVEVPVFAGASYWKSQPDTRPINSEGRPIAKREWYAGLCPTNPWLRTRKRDQIETTLRRFPIDGLWLDFIRYPCHWEVPNPLFEETCFCANCVRTFQRDTRISIPEGLEDTRSISRWILNNHGAEWTSWKCDQIARFVREAKDIRDKERPRAVLGVFTVPWRRDDYSNAIERIVAQDFDKLKEDVDVFSPMAYHHACAKPTIWIGEIVNYMGEKTGKDILPLVQAWDISGEELRQAIGQGLSPESKGVIIFSLKWLLKEGTLEAVGEAFAR